MSGLNIPVIYLVGAAPLDTLIPASELSRYYDATSIVAHALEEAQTIRDEASEVLAQAHRDTGQIRDDARRDGIADAAAMRQKMHTAVVEETVQWLVAETDLEADIAMRLEPDIRTLVAQVLGEFFGEQDATELIVQRITQRLSRFPGGDAVTLRVAAASEAKMKCAFEAYPKVGVTVDASMAPTQAVLETQLVTLQIDLDAHLQSLLSGLAHTPHQENTHA